MIAGRTPEEPPATPWGFPDPNTADSVGVVGVGADLAPGTLLAAYRRGIFPMPLHPGGPMGWWSPDPRGIIPIEGLRVSRSLARSCRRYEIRVDTVFRDVVVACADPGRPGGWITDPIVSAYVRLHELGWAHSIEVWDDDGLAGGLYGVAVGGLFAGESMFSRRTDASKVALVALVRILNDGMPGRLLDVQWVTDHLETLGAIAISRRDYLSRLGAALEVAPPLVWAC